MLLFVAGVCSVISCVWCLDLPTVGGFVKWTGTDWKLKIFWLSSVRYKPKGGVGAVSVTVTTYITSCTISWSVVLCKMSVLPLWVLIGDVCLSYLSVWVREGEDECRTDSGSAGAHRPPGEPWHRHRGAKVTPQFSWLFLGFGWPRFAVRAIPECIANQT